MDQKKAKDVAKKATEKAAFFMRTFRDKAQSAACTAAEQGGQMTSKIVKQVRSKAETVNNTVYKQGMRISQYASSSTPSRSSKMPPRLSKPGVPSMAVPACVSVGAAAYVAEDEKVKSLCALGFSPSVVRHALRRCDGDVEKTGLWLLDEANRDERLAAELEAGELADGECARINGLRGAIHLNGMPVVLQFYDEETQRWIVQMPDGTAKSIRPRNLDRLDPEAAAKASAEMDSAMRELGREAPSRSGPQPNKLDEQLANVLEEVELRKQVREMIGILTGTEEDEALKALSVQELLEVMRSLPEQARAEEAERQKSLCRTADGKEDSSSSTARKEETGHLVSLPETSSTGAAEDEGKPVGMSSAKSLPSDSPKRKASEAAASELRELERKLKESADKMNLWEEQQFQQQKALEAREAELLESQEQWRSEAEAKAEKIRLLESREEAQQQQEAVAPQQPAEAEIEAAAQLEEQLAELRSLQAKAENAAEDLEKMKAKAETDAQDLERRDLAQRQAAEDRELRLLEQEAEQMRVRKALEEEQEKLQTQRRAVLLLQQSLALPVVSPMPSEGNADCIEMPLDDSACTAFEEAVPEGADLSAGADRFAKDAVVFKPPRRSVASSKQSSDGGEDGPVMQQISSDECNSDDDEEEEVWDLDWSQVSTKLIRRSSQSFNETDASPVMRLISRGNSETSPERVPGRIKESEDEQGEDVAEQKTGVTRGEVKAFPETPEDPASLTMKEKMAARQKLCTDATEDDVSSS